MNSVICSAALHSSTTLQAQRTGTGDSQRDSRESIRANHSQLKPYVYSASLGERQSIAQKGVRAIDARNSQLENDSNAVKTSVRAPGLSADEREHPFV